MMYRFDCENIYNMKIQKLYNLTNNTFKYEKYIYTLKPKTNKILLILYFSILSINFYIIFLIFTFLIERQLNN